MSQRLQGKSHTEMSPYALIYWMYITHYIKHKASIHKMIDFEGRYLRAGRIVLIMTPSCSIGHWKGKQRKLI